MPCVRAVLGIKPTAKCLLALFLALPGSSLAKQTVHATPHQVTLASAASSAPTRKEPPAVTLLRHMLKNAGKMAFTGQQTVITFDGGEGAAVVTEEKHFGHRRSRVVFENPPTARGRIAVTDGRCRRFYLPSARAIIENQLNIIPATDAIVNNRLARIQKSYRVCLRSGLEDVDGRAAYRLDLLAWRHDRPWQKLWIDKATGMILRRETYSPSGTQRSVSSWRNIHFFKPDEVLTPDLTLPKAAKISRPSSEQETHLLAEARKMGGAWTIVPQSLGQGFQFESARIVNSMGSRGLYCEYSDGLTAVSLVEVQGQQGMYVEPSEGKVLNTTRVGSHEIEVIARGAFTVLSWTEGSHPRTLSLVAEVSQSTLLTIAKSLP